MTDQGNELTACHRQVDVAQGHEGTLASFEAHARALNDQETCVIGDARQALGLVLQFTDHGCLAITNV